MFFVDVQGTLIDDHTKMPIRGAVAFIDHLNREKIPYMVITNSTKHPSHEFLAYLHSIGLAIPPSHYLDPLMVLENHIPLGTKIAAYGSKPFLAVLCTMGYVLDFVAPEVVLVAIKEDFSGEEYAQMIGFLLGGAALVGMHETSLYAKNHKRYPGVGAILKMLETATSVPYSVVGKPSITFFETALEALAKQCAKVHFSDVTIISDDVTGDILPAQALGMGGIFVLSGKYRTREEILPQLRVQPHGIYQDMEALGEELWKH